MPGLRTGFEGAMGFFFPAVARAFGSEYSFRVAVSLARAVDSEVLGPGCCCSGFASVGIPRCFFERLGVSGASAVAAVECVAARVGTRVLGILP